jgi:hypothetical protein
MSGKRKAKNQLRTNKKRNKGLTLPGYNYLGPFNDVDDTPPTNKADAAARKHDIAYTALGKRAYWTFNQADEDFLEEIKDETDYGAKIAKVVFEHKKKLAEWNILPMDPLQSKKEDNPFLDFHKGSGNFPLTRARKKALERQQLITEFMKKKKANVKPSLLSNLPQTEQTEQTLQMTGLSAKATGSGNEAGLKETPVDDVIDVERGFPSYQFASLPWTGIMFKDSNLYSGIDIGFRMTSPYDVIIGATATDKNTNASGKSNYVELKPDNIDTVYQGAMWYNWYASIYKYYHVVGCKWSILFENLSNDPMWIHQMYLNDTTPPYEATTEDMLNWPDVKSYYVEPMAKYVDANGIKSSQLVEGWQRETNSAQASENFATGNAINSNRRNTLQLSGQYSTGDVSHDIRLDAEVENWTATNANPKLIERLFFRLKPETQAFRLAGDQGAVNYGRKFKYKYTVRLEYLVEFKELVDALRWPLVYNPILPTLQGTAVANTTEKDNENEPMPPA